MSLNVKNEEAHKLAAQIAKQTGETMTEAVTQALRERAERLQSKKFDQKKFDAIMRIAEDFASRMSPEFKDLDIDDLLYDRETGLPK